MIVITHAYSRHNAGDGLLVDLTLTRLRDVGIDRAEVVLLAMDPSSFPEFEHVVKVGTAGRSADVETVRAVITGAATTVAKATPSFVAGEAARVVREADAFVAVGGGYLRAGTRTNRIGTLINHLPQLDAAARSGRPAVYLPQSVGPLTGRVGSLVRSRLDRVSAVHLRDDRSVAEIGPAPRVHRTPDLAVLALADSKAELQPRALPGEPIVVARRLTDAPSLVRELRRLGELLGRPRWGVQAGGVAAKSDHVFYTDVMHVEPSGSVEALVRGDDPGPVVSVRLHGALQSLLAGVPAIHLGYERKSWGAYDDLGLSGWVHPARSFDPEQVAAQVAELQRDPTRFWEAVQGALPRLQQDSARLTESIRDCLRL